MHAINKQHPTYPVVKLQTCHLSTLSKCKSCYSCCIPDCKKIRSRGVEGGVLISADSPAQAQWGKKRYCMYHVSVLYVADCLFLAYLDDVVFACQHIRYLYLHRLLRQLSNNVL